MTLVSQSKAPRLQGLRYLGGHPAAPRELNGIDMMFDEVGVRFDRRGEELGVVPWDELRDLSADAALSVDRMTVPRVFLLGMLAALFKKQERRVLLRLQDNRGSWIFEVDGINLRDLRAGIDAIRSAHVGDLRGPGFGPSASAPVR